MQPRDDPLIGGRWSTGGLLELERRVDGDLPLVDLEEDEAATFMPREAGTMTVLEHAGKFHHLGASTAQINFHTARGWESKVKAFSSLASSVVTHYP